MFQTTALNERYRLIIFVLVLWLLTSKPVRLLNNQFYFLGGEGLWGGWENEAENERSGKSKTKAKKVRKNYLDFKFEIFYLHDLTVGKFPDAS